MKSSVIKIPNPPSWRERVTTSLLILSRLHPHKKLKIIVLSLLIIRALGLGSGATT